jgi:eukaryotic-like serine/threonine-protein kinase
MEAARNVERIGRFEIVRKLASGGMATVSLACLSGEAGFRRLVAIKRLHPHLADEPEFVHMFFDEARLAARIHHPNVVPILEIGKEGKERFLVMEYVEGATLEQVGRQRRGERLKPALAIRMVLDALAGLQAAHDLEDDSGKPLEIVHRDVSPQNILIGLDGLARLTDFGIARATSRVGKTTRSGQFKGKLTYSAPEQVLGHPMDRRTDIYAMGIVLWEVLTGERLFDADSEAEVWQKLLERPIPSPQSVRADVARELGAVVMRALEREPKLRFPSAAAFADALEVAARSAGLQASHRDVAAFVSAASGDRLSERREKVREWLSHRDLTTAALPVATESAPVMAESSVFLRGGAVPEIPKRLPATPTPGSTPTRTPVGVGVSAGPGAGSAPGAVPGSAPGAAQFGSTPPPAADSSGSAPRVPESDPGRAALPYHWSVNGNAPQPPPPAGRPSWPFVVGICVVALLAGLAVIPVVHSVRARAAASAPPPPPSTERARSESANVDAPPVIDPPSPPVTGVVPSSSAARPLRPVAPTRPTATGKNAEFGDRW